LYLDGEKGVEKKEKLVEVYVTIISILVAIKGADKASILVMTLFFVSIIYYFIHLGNDEMRYPVVISGFQHRGLLVFYY
jgi:hypothetical protein